MLELEALFIINRLHAIWIKNYQRGSLRKSHQNGDYLKNKQCEKVVFPQESNLQPLDYLSTALAHVVEQWTGNPKAAGSISAGRQLFCIACFLSSRHSGDSSLGFGAGSL